MKGAGIAGALAQIQIRQVSTVLRSRELLLHTLLDFNPFNPKYICIQFALYCSLHQC